MITVEPIAYVRNSRRDVEDDFWGGVVSEIVMVDGVGAESVVGLEEFSHAEIIFFFDRVAESVAWG